ncbi:hypothetical protein LCGC14_1597040 [marine sediment metagenome]|uniref:Uncharacterized protein n=1 Tax=marine sediment metagenome TaxID=412755 RepID=A0A0F9IYP2_9ZZZZ
MEIQTKFEIGDMIKFNRVITYVAKKKISDPEIHVGIIEKILVSKTGISYLMHSSFQGWVSEEDIICTLQEVKT